MISQIYYLLPVALQPEIHPHSDVASAVDSIRLLHGGNAAFGLSQL